MEELDMEQLGDVAGGRTSYHPEKEKCYLCGKKSDDLGTFGMGFCEVFYKDGVRKLCPECYDKWCNGSLNSL